MPIHFRTVPPLRLTRLGLVAASVLGTLGLAAGAWAKGVEARIVQMQGDVRVNGAAAQTGMVPKGASVVTGVLS